VGNLQQKLQKGKGVERCYKYGYDIHRMRTSEEDFRGRISTFAYDGKGNQTKQQIFGNEGNLVIQRKYDAFGNEILLIDAKGNKTTKKYNSYGSVIQIDYPDDTSETFRYTLNNLLRKHVDQRGIETIYEYDSFGNQRKKTIVFEGKEIAYEERGYDGFILTWLKDLEGNTIKYFYDGAGRKIAEEFTDVKTKEKQRTEYTYDVYSNLATEKILNGANTLISVTIKDVLGRVKEERLEDEKGKVYSKKTYTYDGYDNKEKESRFIDGKEVKTIFTYDSFNRLTSQRDIDDTAYSIEYFDQYENEYGKRVLKKVDTDPLGIRTIRIFDQFDQIRSLEKKSPSGTVLSLEEFQYDKNFNPTIQKSFVYFQGKLDREVELEREYDSMNRLKKLIEAANTEDRKITIYTYFPSQMELNLTELMIL
jgi:YD repeat-containing protein